LTGVVGQIRFRDSFSINNTVFPGASGTLNLLVAVAVIEAAR
jgi:hypothetical protein